MLIGSNYSVLALVLGVFLSFSACGSGGENSRQQQNTEQNRQPQIADSASVVLSNAVLPNAELDNQNNTVHSPSVSSSTPDPTSANSSSSTCPTLIPGPALGLACLHCAEPQARTQALNLAQIMADSCRQNIATTMLVDGTFSFDRDAMGEIVRVITQNGAQLHLYLYLGNGPWQRHWNAVPAKGFGSQIPAEEFRRRIVSDQSLREEYRERIKFIEPLISYAQSLAVVVYVIPMLEDNLDANSARSIEELTLQTIAPFLAFALGRNPCPGCYSGNDSSIAAGVFEDQHIHSAAEPIRAVGGLVTNDGKSYLFPGESSAVGEIPLSELAQTSRQAWLRDNSFVLWRRDFQGLGPEGTSFADPAIRHYPLPSAEQRQYLLEFMRLQ